jgi:predicted DNA binding CopG/RHH family protein
MGKPDPIVKTTLRLPASLLKRAKLAALIHDLTLQDFIVQTLEQATKKGASA